VSRAKNHRGNYFMMPVPVVMAHDDCVTCAPEEQQCVTCAPVKIR
jgi:hypothetical protein